MYKSVPTYKNNEWTVTDFDTKENFTKYIITLFKEPGQYNFDNTALLFNNEADKFNKQGSIRSL